MIAERSKAVLPLLLTTAEANVEVFVWQKPYYHTWTKEREFPWFYEQPYQHWWGGTASRSRTRS